MVVVGLVDVQIVRRAGVVEVDEVEERDVGDIGGLQSPEEKRLHADRVIQRVVRHGLRIAEGDILHCAQVQVVLVIAVCQCLFNELVGTPYVHQIRMQSYQLITIPFAPQITTTCIRFPQLVNHVKIGWEKL